MFRLDTGADITAIPFRVVVELGLEPFDERNIMGYDSHGVISQTYKAFFHFGNVPLGEIEVVATQSGSTLLGLDILSQLKLTLDGPNKSLIIF